MKVLLVLLLSIAQSSTALAQRSVTHDSGMVRVTLQDYQSVIGLIHTMDSDRVRVDFTGGGYGVYPIKQISTIFDYDLHISSLPIETVSTRLPAPYTAGSPMIHSTSSETRSYISPLVLVGASLPSGSGGARGPATSLGVIFAAQLTDFFHSNIALFIMPSLEWKSFGVSDGTGDKNFSVSYAAVTPGLSYRGIVSLGLSVGYGYSATFERFADDLATRQDIKPSRIRTLIEPKVMLGFPLYWDYMSGQAMLVHAAFGYPLQPVFFPPSGQISAFDIQSVRVPELQIGITYTFPLKHRSWSNLY